MEVIKIEHGYVIQGESDGYYEVNGLGDWTLAGEESTASIFTDKEEAEQTAREMVGSHCKVVEVTRTTLFFKNPLSDRQLELLRKLVR